MTKKFNTDAEKRNENRLYSDSKDDETETSRKATGRKTLV
jgi:hypothetical protein